MERDFNLGGRKFRLSKLDPFKQFHIVRRVAPIMSDLLPAFQAIAKAGLTTPEKIEALSEDKKLEAMSAVATPVMNGLSKLTDSDADYVLRNLLAAVAIQQPPANNWAQVANSEMVMMQDLELAVLVQLAGRAFMYNLSGFTNALASTSAATVQA